MRDRSVPGASVLHASSAAEVLSLARHELVVQQGIYRQLCEKQSGLGVDDEGTAYLEPARLRAVLLFRCREQLAQLRQVEGELRALGGELATSGSWPMRRRPALEMRVSTPHRYAPPTSRGGKRRWNMWMPIIVGNASSPSRPQGFAKYT